MDAEDGENEPMMMMSKKMEEPDEEEESEVDPRDSQRKYKVCGTCSPICGTIFIAVIIILELGYLIYELVTIENNLFFDSAFGTIFFLLVLPLLFSIIVFVLFFFDYKNKSTRACIPQALMTAALTNFALLVWILIYIAVIYDYHSVAVERKLNLGPKFESVDTAATGEAAGHVFEKA